MTSSAPRVFGSWVGLLAGATALSLIVSAAVTTAGPAASATGIDTTADAAALGQALQTQAGTVVGASFVERPPSGTPTAVVSLAIAGFPTQGPNFDLLTSGDASLLSQPNTSGSAGANDGGPAVRGDSAFDVSVLKVDLDVPANVNCLVGFDFKFFSEEYPEYVGSAYNDGFVAELDKTTWTTSGSAISAPDNFAFDPSGKVISVNSTGVANMSAAQAQGTTYDAATTLLTAATPITPGAHSLYLSIFDQGDHVLDSAVAVDNLRFGTVADPKTQCIPGAKSVNGIPLGQTFGKTGGYSPGGLPGYTPPGYANNPTGNAGDPVNTYTGAYLGQVTDAKILDATGVLDFTRSYTSADATDGVLGRGWTHNLAASVSQQASGDVLARAGNGQQVAFSRSADGSYVAPPGATSTLTATPQGWTIRTLDGRTDTFDTQGRLLSHSLRTGLVATLTYDSGGRLSAASLPGGRGYTFTYDSAGRLAKLAVPGGRAVRYGYSNGLLTTVTDLVGGITTYTYGSDSLLTEIQDQLARKVVRTAYGADGRVVSQQDAEGSLTTYGWDPATTTATVTDARGGKWVDHYAQGFLIKRTDPLGNETSIDWDSKLLVPLSTKDSSGRTTTWTYDAQGNPLTETAPDGGQLAITTKDGLPATVSAQGNTTLQMAWDAAQRLTSLSSGSGGKTSYERDAAGRVTRAVTVTNDATNFGYDTAGDLTTLTTPSGAMIRLQYDDAGRLSAINRPASPTGTVRDRVEYDSGDRLSAFTDALGHSTRSTYDIAGQLTSVTDANGAQVRYEYDLAGRIVRTTAPDAAVTQYRYDAVGNLIARIDGNGHETGYEYDAANRLITLRAPGGRVWSYTYDGSGRLLTVTDANGNATPQLGDGVTSYTYDKSGRVSGVSYSDGTPGVTFTYDLAGRLTAMSDGAGDRTFTYDPDNRLLATSQGGQTFQYTYDAAARLVSRTYPSGAVVTYTYDADSRLKTVTSGGVTYSYGYDSAGNRTSLAGVGVTEADGYDAANRLIAVTSKAGKKALRTTKIKRDSVGNPTVVDVNGAATTYSYDQLGRVVSECPTIGCERGTKITYDSVGNRKSVTTRGKTKKLIYDEFDQPTGSGAPTFDRNGNQLTLGGRTATYDLANRLIKISGGTTAPAVDLSYDGFGNRIAEKITGRIWNDDVNETNAPKSTKLPGTASAASSLVTRTFAQDLNGPLSVVAEVTTTSSSEGEPNRRESYAFGDVVLGVSGAKGTTQYVRDYLGSVTALAGPGGRSSEQFGYTLDGSPKLGEDELSGVRDSGPRFTGEYFDAFTSLYDLRARTYDPTSARFLQRDPWTRELILPSANAYSYAEGRPTALTDPSGECPWCVLAGVGAVVGGIAGGITYYATTPASQRTAQGWAGAIGGGALAGAVGAVAGPLGGTIATGLGATATGGVATAATFAINGGASALGTYVGNTIAGQPTTTSDLLWSGLGGAAGGWLGGKIAPGTGMTTLKQAKYFAPRTWSGALPWAGPNSTAVWNSAVVGGVVGLLTAPGSVK